MKTAKQLIFFVFIVSVTFLRGQQRNFIVTTRQFSVEDGLATHQVICGLQDNKGFIWFGTRNGLNRFDGENFVLFNQEKDSLKSNNLLQLATDCGNLMFILYGDNNINYTSYGKVDVMNLTTNKVTGLDKMFPDMPFKEKDVVSMGNDKLGNVFFITKTPDILWFYNSKTGFKKKLDLNIWKDPRSAGRRVEAYINNGEIMLAKAYGEFTCFIHNDSMVRMKNKELILSPVFFHYNNQLNVIHTNHGYEVGFRRVSGTGDFIADSVIKVMSEFSDRHDLYTIYSTTDPDVIFKLPDGVWLYTKSDTIKILYAGQIADYNSMRINQLFSDRQGNQWVCTTSGVIEVKVKHNRFTHYFTKEQQSIEPNVQARAIYADADGKVYTDIWRQLFISSQGLTANIVNDDFIFGLGVFNDFICVGGNSVFEYSSSGHKFLKLTPPGPQIWSFYALNKDTLLLGSDSGIEMFQWSEKKLLPLNIGNKGRSHPEVVYRFIHGSDGNIWAAAQNGVYVLNTMGTIIDYYGNTKEAGHELPFSAIYDIHEDSIGVFWFCTGGQGLFRWNKNKNEFRQFTFADGLPANVIYRIEKDNSGNLWISTDYGLTCLNPHNNSIINYDMSDGLSQNEFNRESSFRAANGRLFFGSINGVNAFYPRDFIEDTTYLNVPLQIISFNKFSSSKNKLLDLTTELITGRTISLNPDDKFFNLQFMLLDYKNGKKHYAYKIDGIDKDWNNINENSIRISGLPYGEFTLHIKGRTAAGAWSRSELVIPIIVYTPYYRKAWFIILSLLSIIFLVYGIIRYRTRRLEIEKVRLENIVSDRTSELKLSLDKQQGLLKEKDMLLKEIHHRVKNNLQVISNLLEMQNVGIDDERAKSVIKEGQNRVRSIALIHQKLYQNEDIAAIDLADFTNELFSQVMGLFRKPGLTITKEINIGKVLLDIDTAVPLGLILNELFTNTFKYAFTGNTGHITITFEDLGGGNYSIIYKDNGKGLLPHFDMNKAHSVGLWLVVSLSKQLGGEAKYEYENGSKFSIYFKDTPARKDID